MTNSEARKRHQTAQTPVSGPNTAPVDSGAIGRLSDAERAAIVEAFDHDAEANCWSRGCEHGLWGAVERIVREHTDRALAEAWDKGWCAGRGRGPGHTDACPIGGGRHANPYRAARQERGR